LVSTGARALSRAQRRGEEIIAETNNRALHSSAAPLGHSSVVLVGVGNTARAY